MPYEFVKRLMDLIMAFILGFVFLPIGLVIAILIKLESPDGPVFADTPLRVGKSGKLFYAFKFRSMIPNAVKYLHDHPDLFEEYKKNSFKLQDDPRVLKVGKFIRKFSLDEAPQFINVLKGEMSLIGPRPYYKDELEEQQSKYPETKPLVKEALSVRPGISGLWQVSGRSEVNFDKRIVMDAGYARDHNLWYDLKILFKTPFVMLSAKGAV